MARPFESLQKCGLISRVMFLGGEVPSRALPLEGPGHSKDTVELLFHESCLFCRARCNPQSRFVRVGSPSRSCSCSTSLNYPERICVIRQVQAIQNNSPHRTTSCGEARSGLLSIGPQILSPLLGFTGLPFWVPRLERFLVMHIDMFVLPLNCSLLGPRSCSQTWVPQNEAAR